MHFYVHSANRSLPSGKPRIYLHCLESHGYKTVRTSNIKTKLYAVEGGRATIINLFKLICQEWQSAGLKTVSNEGLPNLFTYKLNDTTVQAWLHLLAEGFMRKPSQALQSDEAAFCFPFSTGSIRGF